MGKSCKPIPILIAGVLFAHKSYHWRKYMYILLIVFGMAVFLYKEKPGTHDKGFNFGSGEGFLVSIGFIVITTFFVQVGCFYNVRL